MTFMSTLQLRIFGDHSLDKRVASPGALVERDGENHSERRFSNDGPWSGFKREEVHNGAAPRGFTHAPCSVHPQGNNADPSAPGFHHEPMPIHSGCAGSGASASSDWNVISSNSFDDAYLEEGDYSNGAMAPLDPPSNNHFSEHLSKLGLETGDHDLPVFSMPYPGTSWFSGGKNAQVTGSGFALPPVGGGGAPHSTMTEPGAAFSVNSSAASFRPSDAAYPGKLPSDALPYPSDAPSPVQMEGFAPCLPYALEPSELLFEDVNTWPGATGDAYDHHHYPQQHGQPFYNLSTQAASSTAHCHFDAPGASMPAGLHEYASSYQQSPPHSSAPAASSVYRLMQSREDTYPSDPRWPASEASHQYSSPSTACTTPTGASAPLASSSDPGNQRPNALSSLLTPKDESAEQSMKRVLRSSTRTQRAPINGLHNVNPMFGKLASYPVTSSAPANQSARIQLLTALNDCYWKNGRKNLQCFPSCPEHHDFYSMKMNNRKHSSVGVCRGPVYCHAFTDAAEFLPAASTQQMKHDGEGSASGNGARELFVLGRFERVPQQESTNLLEELYAPPTFPSAAVFEQFRYTCFQAVEMEERRVLLPEAPAEPTDLSSQGPDSSPMKSGSTEGGKKRIIRSTWFFLPDVWKVQPMLKKKRKATRSAPAQTFPFCFRIFIYSRDADSPGFSCVADTASSFFELYSTRTVDRVKRKYWSGESASRPAGRTASKQRGLKRL
jgi:hypothetical protein